MHAAGTIKGRSIDTIENLRIEDYRKQFAPKINGLININKVFSKRDLDFCLVISSISAQLGGLGYSAYASANAFMDHYINKHKNNGNLKNWISVNLDRLNRNNFV